MTHRLKIYVIDDAQELCQELRDWLNQSGHEVLCSRAERTITHTLAGDPPNLIILSIIRYGGRGMELFRKLSNHRQLRHVPIIAVSDDASLEYELLDAFDFQVRPFDRERLQVCLERLSGSRKYLSPISFAEPELAELKSFLLKCSGLHFSQHNHRILERGLMRRIQALRMASLPAYFDYLTATPDNYDEVNKLLGLLTVGETSFFRYRSHREALLHHVIPRLLQQNRTHCKLRIWSAGCSTGEEPYSVAILLLEHFPELVGWDVQILATDINKRSLSQAREGVYGERSLRMMEGSLRERYFEKVGSHFLLSSQVKRMVRFDFLNLQTDIFPAESNATNAIDLLFCRNVLIYFELDTIRKIVEKFSRTLKPQGYLFMGHAETMQNISDRFQRHHQDNAFFYQCKESRARPTAEKIAIKIPGEGSVKAPVKLTRSLDKSARPPGPSERKTEQPRNKTATVMTAPGTPRQQDQTTAPSDSDRLYRDALAAFDHERFVEAAKLFDRLLELEPTHARALVGKGLLLANQGKYGDARICCAKAIKEDDLLPEAYLLRGLILDMEGALVRALVEYQKVLWLDPSFVMAHYLAAKAHGSLAEAEKKQRSLRNVARVLEQCTDQDVIPFSGGLSRGVFLEIVRRELSEVDKP